MLATTPSTERTRVKEANVTTRVRRPSMRIPLDADGYLRRECPNCERDFKRLVRKVSEAELSRRSSSELFCPYCGLRSPSNTWLTKAQIEYTKKVLAELVARERTRRGVKTLLLLPFPGSSRLTNGELSEANDMKVVRPPCHSEYAIKVSDLWIGDLHCAVCGARNAQ
jgi:hypothetical protein